MLQIVFALRHINARRARLDYRSHKVKQGAVVYLALEGGIGFHNRVEAWRRRHLQAHDSDVPFYLLTVPVDLIADHQKLIAAIKAQALHRAAVVIDTLNRSLTGDENKSADMAAYVRASDVIRTAFDCVVAIVHHCGIAGSRPRGHTSLSGADDAQIAVERDEKTGVISATVEYMKDGVPGTVILSRLESVVLGDDDDGDELTSCVIAPVEGEPTAKRPAEPTGQAKIALDLLKQALADHGEPAPASNHIPGQSRVVRTGLWKRYCDAGTVT
jgi:hypothetical protein